MSNNKKQQHLIRTIENQLEWGAASTWHNSMFAELSGLILNKCGVDLSTATLKRFFGTVKHDGTPSITTLDTLSQFAGYENWRSFKLTGRRKSWLEDLQLPNKGIYLTIGFIMAFIVIVVIGTRRPNSPEDFDMVSFSSRSVTNSYPNSVVFDFDLNGMESDDMYIQQFWDPTKTITLQPGQTQATGIYYYPGYFRARLFIDGDTVRQHELFLKSNGWLGTIDYEPVPKYFRPLQAQSIALSLSEKIAKEIEQSSGELTSTYSYINDLGNVDADNFKLETELKINYNDKWAVCQKAWIYIIGSKGAIFIPFSILGCSADNNMMLNENFIDGSQTDLSALSVDLSSLSTISIENNDKAVEIEINNQLVYTDTYKKPLGKVVGLRFEFVGHGEVKSFRLVDQKDNQVVF